MTIQLHACVNINNEFERMVISKRENRNGTGRHIGLNKEEKKLIKEIGATWNAERQFYSIVNPKPEQIRLAIKYMTYEDLDLRKIQDEMTAKSNCPVDEKECLGCGHCMIDQNTVFGTLPENEDHPSLNEAVENLINEMNERITIEPTTHQPNPPTAFAGNIALYKRENPMKEISIKTQNTDMLATAYVNPKKGELVVITGHGIYIMDNIEIFKAFVEGYTNIIKQEETP